GRHGEIEGVAEGAVLAPFAVDAIVLDPRLDLADDDVAARPQRHHVGAPPVRQAHLKQRCVAYVAQEPGRAAGHRLGGLRTAEDEIDLDDGTGRGARHRSVMFRFRSGGKAVAYMYLTHPPGNRAIRTG